MYNYDWLNSETKIFGLIGAPVEHSIGPAFHNEYFRRLKHNAVYVKWHIKKEELAEAVPLLKKLVTGLSVTMPLKEQILKYTEEIDPETKKIGSLNTIFSKNNIWHGTNTDGIGAMQALEVPVKNKIVAILGAGGAARALIYTAVSLGAKVFIFNRDKEKAENLAQLFGAEKAYELDKIRNFEFDILINTLPFSVKVDLDANYNSNNTHKMIMDITNTEKDSWLFNFAKKHHFQYKDRIPMFKKQALLQLKFWGFETNSF